MSNLVYVAWAQNQAGPQILGAAHDRSCAERLAQTHLDGLIAKYGSPPGHMPPVLNFRLSSDQKRYEADGLGLWVYYVESCCLERN